ncbi:hypothetical protein IJT10_02715 [bacterium]|nr:hypothetical protein [bacterium]
MLLLFALPAIAQNSQQIQQSKPEIVINGNPLPPTAILGYTGSDWAVKATPFLSFSGAVVSVMNNRMEATWIDSTLVIVSEENTCQYNEQVIPLQLPCGMYQGDMIVQLSEICRIINATVEVQDGKIIVWNKTSSNTPVDVAQGGPAGVTNAKAGYLNSFASGNIPGLNSRNSRTSNTGYSEPDRSANQSFDQANLNNPNQNANMSPYERPIVSLTNIGGKNYTLESPRSAADIAASNPANAFNSAEKQGVMGAITNGQSVIKYSPTVTDPAQARVSDNRGVAISNPPDINQQFRLPKPAKIVATSLFVEKDLSNLMTAYEITTKIRNDGEVACEKPFMVKIMAMGNRHPGSWEMLENYLIDPLQPGQEVEITKKADGNQFPTLQSMRIIFKVSVLEEVPNPHDGFTERNWQTKNTKYKRLKDHSQTTPKVREVSSIEKETHF